MLFLIFLFHLFEQSPELLQRDLPIPVRVQLGHELLHLLLAHVAAAELAELTGVYRARVVLVYRLARSFSISIISPDLSSSYFKSELRFIKGDFRFVDGGCR